jgi:hypothetical protein
MADEMTDNGKTHWAELEELRNSKEAVMIERDQLLAALRFICASFDIGEPELAKQVARKYLEPLKDGR